MYKRALKVVGDTLDGRGRYLLDGDTAISVHPDDSMNFAEHRGSSLSDRPSITRLHFDDLEHSYKGKKYKYDRDKGILSVLDDDGRVRSVNLNDPVDSLEVPLDDSGATGSLSYNPALYPSYKLRTKGFGDIEFLSNGLRYWQTPESKSGRRGIVEELIPGRFTALPGSESGYGWWARRRLRKLLNKLPSWKVGKDGTLTNPKTGSKYGLRAGKLVKLAKNKRPLPVSFDADFDGIKGFKDGNAVFMKYPNGSYAYGLLDEDGLSPTLNSNQYYLPDFLDAVGDYQYVRNSSHDGITERQAPVDVERVYGADGRELLADYSANIVFDPENESFATIDTNTGRTGEFRKPEPSDMSPLKVTLSDGDTASLSYNPIYKEYMLSTKKRGRFKFDSSGMAWRSPGNTGSFPSAIEEPKSLISKLLMGRSLRVSGDSRNTDVDEYPNDLPVKDLKSMVNDMQLSGTLPSWEVQSDGTIIDKDTGSKYGPKNGRLVKLAAYIKAAADPRYLRVSDEGEHDIQTAAGDLLTLSADGQEGFVSNNDGIFRIHPKGMSYFKGKSVYDYDPIDDKWVNAVSGALLKKMIKRPDLRWEDGVFYNPITGVRYGVQGTRPYYQRHGEDPVRMRLRRKKRKKR